MANALWDGLGKLAQMGATWVQHVQQARAAIAAGEQGQSVLHAYLAKLNDSEFNGFKLAIAMAVQGEANPQIRQLLAWIVQNADELRMAHFGGPSESPAPGDTTTTGEYEQVVAHVNEWLPLPPQDVATRLRAVIEPMDEAQRARLVAHMQQLLGVTQQNLSAAEDNSNTAWGSSYEDRMAYMSARMSTGQRDPRVEQQLQTLRGHVAFVGQLLEGARMLVLAPQAAPREATQPVPQAAQGADVNSFRQFAQVLRAQLEEAIASGKIRPGRETALRNLTDEVVTLATQSDSGAISSTDAHAAMMRLVERSRDMLVDAGPDVRTKLPETSLARTLVEPVHALKRFASEVGTRAPGSQMKEAGIKLYAQGAQLLAQLGELADDAAALEFECTALRPLALDAHRLARAPYARPALPVWDCPPIDLSPSRVFVAAPAEFRSRIKRLLRGRRMDVEGQTDGRAFGQARWDELRRSAVAVFDWRAYRKNLFHEDSDAALQLAGISYEFGLALALGKPLVVVAAEGQALPFDIDIEPLRWNGNERDDAAYVEAFNNAINNAINSAMYGWRLAADATSLGVALDVLDAWSLDAPRRGSIEGMGWLKRELATDALAFEGAAHQVLRELGRGELITPAWASHARAADLQDARLLFHVMPFSAAWSDDISAATQAACKSTGVTYVRGDTMPDSRILNRVWDGICHADAVLVELTGLNANVLIELGIAHALGCNVLLVEQAQQHAGKVRHLEKFELVRYEQARDLRAALVQWLG
jgi:hypothetical protein